MELDLRLRRLELPQGVTLVCKPMNLSQFQRWITAIQKTQGTTAVDQIANTELMNTAEALLRECIQGVEGVTIRATDSTPARPGTFDDLLAVGGIGMGVLFRAVTALFQSSGLPEIEAKNSAAPQIAGQPGPAALPVLTR
jgi:glutamate 5-kinase